MRGGGRCWRKLERLVSITFQMGVRFLQEALPPVITKGEYIHRVSSAG